MRFSLSFVLKIVKLTDHVISYLGLVVCLIFFCQKSYNPGPFGHWPLKMELFSIENKVMKKFNESWQDGLHHWPRHLLRRHVHPLPDVLDFLPRCQHY